MKGSRRALEIAAFVPVTLAGGVLIQTFVSGARNSDFRLFYEYIERAGLDLPLYGPLTVAGRVWAHGPNLNPPHFYVLVAPFTILSLNAAFVGWMVAGAAAILGAAFVAQRDLRANWTPTAAVIILNNAALNSTVRTGQLSFLLALPVTLAWRAARHARWTSLGAWLGLAASVKPFLLIVLPYLVLRRLWRAVAVMVLTICGCVATGALVFGVEAVRDWVGVLAHQGRMDTHFHNASWVGFAARALPAHWRTVSILIAVVGVLVTVAVAYRTHSVNRAWLLMMIGALLWSPLGWIYYGWILMPPAVAWALEGRMPRLIWAGAMLWLWPPYTPSLSEASPFVAGTAGSVYFWGLLLAWVGAAQGALTEAAHADPLNTEQ